MLESGLFFILGFLCSALLALMVAPAIWRRAVVLTRQRIESSVPLTLNEIQADKDQLRAEFAMSTRRLEVSLEQLKERAAEQLIEINRRRDNVVSLEEEQAEKSSLISGLETHAEELGAQMRQTEDKLNSTTVSLANVEMQLEEKSASFDELRHRHRNAVDEFDGQKIEMVARETRIDTVQHEAREFKSNLKETQGELDRFKGELKVTKSNLTKERNRTEEQDAKMSRMTAHIADMENRLERRDSDIKRLREQSGDTGAREQVLEKELDDALTNKVRLEAQLAEAALRTETLLRDASGENVESAMAVFEHERSELQDQLADSIVERDQLKSTIAGIQMTSGDDWDTERRENAIVRERINDLAAKVTAMTADLEGPESPINKILDKDEKSARPGNKNGKVGEAFDKVNSLADRIRAIQAATEKAS